MKNISYLREFLPIIDRIDEQADAIDEVAVMCAEVISSGRMVHLFGSGTSALPIQDIFPRYGGFLGWHPLLDRHLLWTEMATTGNAKELLWIEKQEGYIEKFLSGFNLQEGEVMIVYSHDCNNIANTEAAMYAERHGLKVVVITSQDCIDHGPRAMHSTKQRVTDFADVVIDNGCPLEDALIEVPDYPQRVGASSTLSAILISQSIASETALRLEKMGHKLYTFVSPTVESCPRDWSETVFEKYSKLLKENDKS